MVKATRLPHASLSLRQLCGWTSNFCRIVALLLFAFCDRCLPINGNILRGRGATCHDSIVTKR